MIYQNIREEELKNKVAQDFFDKFDHTEIIKDIDFAVKTKNNSLVHDEYLLWAEVKAAETDMFEMLTQLVLTIGKARTFDKILPPSFLGCFDCAKIVFIHYFEVQEIFYQNDFNWKVTPSNRETREFKQVYEQISKINDEKIYKFDFEKDEKELQSFIKENFVIGKIKTSKIKIDKNNFINIYNKWLEAVKPTIDVDWDIAKKNGVIDGYFYLADLLSSENKTLTEKLYVVLNQTYYIMNRHKNEMGLFTSSEVRFIDNQKAYMQFWAKYERPPKVEYWDYIIMRQDLLVPQDVRERKGSFFTPKIWVELSQKYIADVFGEDWQDEYYVWDCAAGTGNLLAGLTNKYNIWASTLDKADVDVIHERIENGANLLKEHCFQFDFLNDDFDKLPINLQKIINDEEKRKKLIIYINPPYAEVSSKDIKGKVGVNQTNIHKKYTSILGTGGRELYVQFLIRIYFEIVGCKIGEFSTMKTLQGSAFSNFRSFFHAKLEKMFVVPANTFDNVKGSFPIGFKIWSTNTKEEFLKIKTDIFDFDGNLIGKKIIYALNKEHYINKYISLFKEGENGAIGFMDGINGNDFQHNNIVYILNKKEQLPNPRGIWINKNNLIPVSIYLTVRKVISADWLNDRDQFLYPNNKWEMDEEFQSDCLTYTIFSDSNNIQSKFGVNHWIPFTENEVNSREKFESNFMTDFIMGKVKFEKEESDLFGKKKAKGNTPLQFSPEAKSVFNAGRELWKYYHAQPKCNVNASLYDIREYFQGRNDKGKMNNKSTDEKYNELVGNLRVDLKILAKKIEPKVYEYGFLKR